MQDLPYYSLPHRDYTLQGYSRGPVQSYWRIPEFNVGFDMGGMPWDFIGTPTWLISHPHMDHLAAIHQYCTRRRMMKMVPPTVYLPTRAIAPVRHILAQWQLLDYGSLPCNLIPIEPDQEIALSRELVVKTFATSHSIASMGFLVYNRRNKLKPEYTGFDGNQLKTLRESGEEITYEIRVPQVAFMGDCRPDSLLVNEDILKAQMLIMEMTFVAIGHSRNEVHKFGHTDLMDFVDLAKAGRFHNEVIIASHFSARYSDAQIRNQVRKLLPDMLGGRLRLFV